MWPGACGRCVDSTTHNYRLNDRCSSCYRTWVTDGATARTRRDRRDSVRGEGGGLSVGGGGELSPIPPPRQCRRRGFMQRRTKRHTESAGAYRCCADGARRGTRCDTPLSSTATDRDRPLVPRNPCLPQRPMSRQICCGAPKRQTLVPASTQGPSDGPVCESQARCARREAGGGGSGVAILSPPPPSLTRAWR